MGVNRHWRCIQTCRGLAAQGGDRWTGSSVGVSVRGGRGARWTKHLQVSAARERGRAILEGEHSTVVGGQAGGRGSG